MILLALVPPLWRRVMDPRLLAHYGGDVTRANIHPPARKRLIAQYAANR
jgi:alkane 1-monooxygenase